MGLNVGRGSRGGDRVRLPHCDSQKSLFLERPPPDPRDSLERPSLKAALALLLPAALVAGLFYLWLRDLAQALVYGGMLGAGLAAIGVEFIKYFRSYREHPGEAGASPAGAMRDLAVSAFRLGFVKTFTEIIREIFKLIGLKVVVSIVIAVTAFFVARSTHLF